MNDEYLRLQDTIADRDRKIEDLDDEVDSLKRKVKNLDSLLENKEGENKELNELVSELESEAEETQSTKEDDPEDCRRSLYFAITELEEVERGEVSLADKLFDLRMRHCKFL
jgi:chromosome segregation ATPase